MRKYIIGAIIGVIAGMLAILPIAASAVVQKTQQRPTLFEVVKPNKRIVLFEETGLNLANNVVCYSNTNDIGAPFEHMTCHQFNK